MAAKKQTCGKLTADGTPCRNPVGCTVRHPRWERTRDAVRVGSVVSAARAAAEADDARLRSFPGSAATATEFLAETGMLVTHDYENTVDASDVMEAFAEIEQAGGFTYAPASTVDGWHDPLTGICVALHGTDMLLTRDAFALEPSKDGVVAPPRGGPDAIMDWLDHLRPLFDSGHVWIGGYRRKDGGYELNATVVFAQEDREAALLFAATQHQETAYDKGTGKIIDIGGDAGGSLYTDRHRTRLGRLMRRQAKKRGPPGGPSADWPSDTAEPDTGQS